MKKYNVTGMSCAACSARVEKAVKGLPGVTACSVNLLTNSMTVEGNAREQDIITAVVSAGYGASPADNEEKNINGKEGLSGLFKRLILSGILLLILMYFSMGHMMWDWPVPEFLRENHMAVGILQMILSGMILFINGKFFVSGTKGVLHGAPNMDTLVALGSGVSYVYSVVILWAKPGEHLYFESAAMILVLITFGKLLESYSKGKTVDALKTLLSLAPKTATLLREGKEVVVAIEKVATEDIFVVRPGESIPVDGIVLEGHSAVDESVLTGESIPVDKEVNASVSAGTMNKSGFLKCKATRVGADTTLSEIIQLVSDAAATKAPIAKIADRVSGIFVPVVIGISILTMIIWALFGADVGFWLSRGIAVLVISCPCALGLATPVAIMVGNGVGARNGILFKNAITLENAGRTQILAVDKTGTITKGEPVVTEIFPVGGETEESLLMKAAKLEQKSEHPLGKAIRREAETRQFPIASSETDFEVFPGNGLRLGTLIGGSLKFMKTMLEIPREVNNKADAFAKEGKTPLLFAENGELLGIIGVADTLKEDSKEAVEQLENMGIRVVMITGDNELTAWAVAKEAGIKEVFAGVLPDGKEAVIRNLMRSGRVAMVGDGINDAPALTRADIGIAIGAGTDVAIEAADIVLIKSRFLDVPAAIRLSRLTLRNIHENLFWAFFYNVIGIPLAAGVWYPVFGWELSPMFGAAAMGLSSFCVVSNALRLNLARIYNNKRDKKVKPLKEEKMEKTMTITGMMCTHCSGHVTKALEAVDGVVKADVSHETGKAIVSLSKDVKEEVLKAAVENEGYQVVGIE